MSTTVKGFLKGLRYISQVFEEKDQNNMQIGFPTDVKHVAHIGSDGPAANAPSWMGDFKPQELENGQVVSRGDANQVGDGVGLQELLPNGEKLKQKKSRRKSTNGSPPRRNSSATTSDMIPRHASKRHHSRRHRSIDSSNDPSMRRRSIGVVGTDLESSHGPSDGSTHSTRKPRSRKVKGTGGGGELSTKKSTRAKSENTNVLSVDSMNTNNTVSDVD